MLWLDGVHRKYIEEVGTMNIMLKIGDEVITPPLAGTILAGVTRDSALTLMRAWGMRVAERPVTIDEVRRGGAPRHPARGVGTGTAAVISPVGELAYKGERIVVNGGRIGELTQKLYDTIVSIQYATAPDTHGWMVISPDRRRPRRASLGPADGCPEGRRSTRGHRKMGDCVFCKIRDGQIPSVKLYEDERTLAIMDINPLNPGHCLVITRTHAATVWEAGPRRSAGGDRDRAARWRRPCSEAVKPDGLNVLQANGAAAFQSVPHFHLHLIPRWTDDGKGFDWELVPGDRAQIITVGERLRNALGGSGDDRPHGPRHRRQARARTATTAAPRSSRARCATPASR